MVQVILCDRSPLVVYAWRGAFARFPDVEITQDDLLDIDADAFVSPANSFGFMDGGIDAALAYRFPGVDERLRKEIAARGMALLPVGEALVVETGDIDVPYLVSAPTMTIPSDVAGTANAYLAMLALLRAVDRF